MSCFRNCLFSGPSAFIIMLAGAIGGAVGVTVGPIVALFIACAILGGSTGPGGPVTFAICEASGTAAAVALSPIIGPISLVVGILVGVLLAVLGIAAFCAAVCRAGGLGIDGISGMIPGTGPADLINAAGVTSCQAAQGLLAETQTQLASAQGTADAAEQDVGRLEGARNAAATAAALASVAAVGLIFWNPIAAAAAMAAAAAAAAALATAAVALAAARLALEAARAVVQALEDAANQAQALVTSLCASPPSGIPVPTPPTGSASPLSSPP